MAKTKTSPKRKKYSLADLPTVRANPKNQLDHNPAATLRDRTLISQALVECLLDGDREAFFEIIEAHYKAVNTDKALKVAKLAKTTFYEALKKRDSTLTTVFKMFKGLELSDKSETRASRAVA